MRDWLDRRLEAASRVRYGDVRTVSYDLDEDYHSSTVEEDLDLSEELRLVLLVCLDLYGSKSVEELLTNGTGKSADFLTKYLDG